MKQVILKKGIVFSEEVAKPVVSEGSVLIRTVVSCISAGTELASIQTSEKPLIKRAMEQPEKVRKVVNWLRQDGIRNAYKHVQNELNVGTTLGYSLSGIVVATGKNISGFQVGNRVAAAGGTANHAEYVEVPANLVTGIPDNVSHMHASTVAIGAIAMQSVRRADLRMGEFAVVIGCGLLGLLVVQMLTNSGVRVAATDLAPDKLLLADDLGAELTVNPGTENPVRSVQQWADGHGADAVIFAAATDSNKPLSQAFNMCRRKGRVILLGVAGMQIDRKDIYQKELDFMISTSYGPGRYDLSYEEKGVDYPYAYVRWTEKRNLTEFIRLVANGRISFDRFTCNTFPVEKVSEAFSAVKTPGKGATIMFLQYADEPAAPESTIIQLKIPTSYNTDCINIGLVGAGNFAKNMHIPNIAKLNKKFHISAVMDKSGYNAKLAAQSAGGGYSTTDFDDLLADKNIQLIMICTRHDSHASMVLKALKAGKHVFVEKPLATNQSTLDKIASFYSKSDNIKPVLMVGFNRRFSPYAQEIKKHTDKRINPLFIHYRMNAGFIALDHWVHENGGRMVGEACHIIDLMTFFTGSRIHSVSHDNLSPTTEAISPNDNKSIILKYEDGSVATIEYFAVGNNNYPKEFMELHFDQKTITMDDYKSVKGFGQKIREIQSSHHLKGHFQELAKLHGTLTGKDPKWPIELWDLLQTTKTTFLLMDKKC